MKVTNREIAVTKTKTETKVLLSIRKLVTKFYTYEGTVHALDEVDLDIRENETMGLVGETGCGKSVTALSALRLIQTPPGKIESGEVFFEGEDLLKKSGEEIRKIRGSKISMIFQDPMTYLNPVYSIGDQIGEVIKLHENLDSLALEKKISELQERLRIAQPGEKVELEEQINQLTRNKNNPPKASRGERKKAVRWKIVQMLKTVRLPEASKVVDQYPHELSGGMRQRAIIAMMLAARPKLLIGDEPTTALDVTIQAQVLRLLSDLRNEMGLSVLIITHDLGIVAETCDRVCVMYAGTVVESGPTERLFQHPLHPYTSSLLGSIPRITEDRDRLNIIPGSVPNLIRPPPGCRYHPRCPYATNICREAKPENIEVEQDHWVRCVLYRDVKTNA